MFLKLSLNTLLYIFVMTMAFSIDENARNIWHDETEFRPLNRLVPLHYYLKISLMPGYVSHGESNITVYVNSATRYITLLISEYMNITKVNLESSDSGIIYVPKFSYSHNKDIVILDFAEQSLPENNLECGVYTLHAKFSNYINDTIEFTQTWYTHENEDKKFVATLFQKSTETRQLFPCLDMLTFQSFFNITVEHDSGYKVLSNMPIRKYQYTVNDTMVTHFHMCPRMFVDDVTLILMTSDMISSDPTRYDSYSEKIMINTWWPSHLVPYIEFARDVVGNVTIYLEDNWEILKRGPKVDYVVIPNFRDKVMQIWGLLFYDETYIFYNEELHPAGFKTVAIRAIAHDIIYHWFGDLLNPCCFKHWWLNEGFIKFVETYIVDKVFPNSRMMDLFIIQDLHESRYLDVYFPSDIYGEFARDTFRKFTIQSLSIRYRIIGPILWRMLESVFPNNTFWMSINTYFNTKSTYFNSITPDDLWNIMQTAIDQTKIKDYKLNIKQVINSWTKQNYCPVLNAIRDYSRAHVNISMDEKFKQIPFFIPVTYTTETNINFNISLPTIDYCLTESNPESKISIKNEDQWIIINIQQTGYYRVNYDPENWRRIARYLNSENYTNIHVFNRAQIIDDAFHLALEKKLNFSIFWDLGSYLPKREKNYIAWYPMIKAFEYLSNIFAIINVPDKNLPPVLQEVLVKIKVLFEHRNEHIYTFIYRYEDIHDQMEPIEDDLSKYLKQELIKWGCVINNYLCIEEAKNKLDLYVQNCTINKISPGWEKWTYCNGLKRANVSAWYTAYLMALNMYKENSDYKMLEYFGCSENPNIILNYLWHVIPEFEKEMLRDHEMLAQENERKVYTLTANMFLFTLARHAKNTAILKEILKYYAYLEHRYVNLREEICHSHVTNIILSTS